jgi:hypothetical protein
MTKVCSSFWRDELRRLPLNVVVAAASLWGGALIAQTPEQLREVHERVTMLIREMASRPLTPGDTFLTWNPDPGGLIHTVAVDAGGVRSSLLRGDGMIGTADVRWTHGHPVRFDVRWTRRDSATARSTPDRAIQGVLVGNELRVTGRKPETVRVPDGRWAVMDFGMEEELIPLIQSLEPSGAPQILPVYRPWHGRWDSLTVTARDTAGLRFVEVLGTDKAHQLMAVTSQNQLLWILRLDQPAERRPLEGSARYEEYLVRRELLAAVARRHKM